ncbi:MAG: excinuclease ABC subunit UvrC [Campylobacterales bacterium]|nr:excinuclease ABC subunit UvrC [Campylobacterales bacterium]
MQLETKVKSLPSSAGVYQYFDAKGRLLYIGKAKNLKNRVKSYFRFTPSFRPNATLSPRIAMMLGETVSMDYIIVESEEDALILENSLIKQLKPKFNILLRDDKTYPYIYIDESLDFPRFEITRKVIKGKNISYYGPFPSGGRELLNALYELYPLVQKSSCLRGKKACLFYQIKKCLAPCEGLIDKEEYHGLIQKAKKAIKQRSILIKKLHARMFELSNQERFEEAAAMRDQMAAIKALEIQSTIDFASDENFDIFAIVSSEDRGVVIKIFMREGKIISSTHSYFRQTHNFDANSAYKQALLEFYLHGTPFVPSEILVADDFDDKEDLEELLIQKLNKRIKLSHPKIGKKARLMEIAHTNAKELLKMQERDTTIEQALADLLNLASFPYRVEIFDNSHLQGEATVGGMVVWDEGGWDKKSYRRYQLQSKDEVAQMHEMLSRRIQSEEALPDLWVLDGGQANLNTAKKILEQKGVNLDVIAIAKEKIDAKANRSVGKAHDSIYCDEGIIKLQSSDKRLQWIQRLRDEAHRYAIDYHKNLKRKQDKSSLLLQKKGVGEATIAKLISYFGTFEAIEAASFDEIRSVTNIKIASVLKS